MEFFDLNIPYNEKDVVAGASEKDNAAKKASRLKAVVKAMELGYSGIAYDKLLKGVMSDKDRCTITPFPLSSLLKAAPTLVESVKFHRQLLGVPTSAMFRQYRRLTVAVDSLVGASVLNSGNPVLKSYDLVAVRPMNQVAFDQACKVAEVDLIAINFSQKLPFRLKLPMVKAAIERGIYFEITYSHLISSTQSRREMLPNAKMLINWTHAKNVIISSAAPTANEVRGPYDVANLFSLLGLSTERAKAAITKNCRSLLASALRKKQCYKEAIRIESISPRELKFRGGLLSSWSNWDPISSGDGDLPSLDNSAKFSNVVPVPQEVPKSYVLTEQGSNQNKLVEKHICREENTSQSITLHEEDSLPRSNETFANSDLPSLHPCNGEHEDRDQLEKSNSMEVFRGGLMDSDSHCISNENNECSSKHDVDSESEDMLVEKSIVHSKVLDELVKSNSMEAFCGGPMDSGSHCISNENDEFSSKHAVDSESRAMHEEKSTVQSKVIGQEDFSLHACDVLIQECHVEALPCDQQYDEPLFSNCSPIKENINKIEALGQENSVPIITEMEGTVNIATKEQDYASSSFPVINEMERTVNIETKEQVYASSSFPEGKQISGKSRYQPKRKNHFFPVASKGFLKPFLFKKKVHRLKGSKTQQTSVNSGIPL